MSNPPLATDLLDMVERLIYEIEDKPMGPNEILYNTAIIKSHVDRVSVAILKENPNLRVSWLEDE